MTVGHGSDTIRGKPEAAGRASDDAAGRREMPFVSVIVVARDEEASIGSCLARLVAQDYPADRLEIIVADGMSTDRTKEVVEGFPAGEIPLRVLPNPGLGRTQGLNVAVRAARGDVIARVDARTLIESDYVSRCVDTLAKTGADNVGGVQRAVASVDGSPTQRAIAISLAHPLGVGGAQFRLGRRSGCVDTVYLGCFRRDVFERVGLFDEGAPIISEDTDINYRIRKSGGKVYLDNEIMASYVPRDNLKDFWRLYVRYGGGKAGFLLKHGTLAAPRQLALALFVAALGVLALLSPFSRLGWQLFLGLLGVYALGNLLVSTSVALRAAKPSLLPYLALAFACIHFGWAFGFFRRLTQRQRPGKYWKY